MRLADRLAMRQVLLLGEDELAASAVTLRNLRTGDQETVDVDDLTARLGDNA